MSSPITAIANQLGQHLRSKRLVVGTAESCTGGMLTSQLIEFAGSSSYLQQGLVTYSNQAKQKVLGISADTRYAWCCLYRMR